MPVKMPMPPSTSLIDLILHRKTDHENGCCTKELTCVEWMYAHRFRHASVVASDSSSFNVALIDAAGKHRSDRVACSAYGTAGRYAVDKAVVLGASQFGPI